MNKNCYRVIFNPTRGIMTAVSELVHRSGKSVSERDGLSEGGFGGGGCFSLRIAAFSILLAVGAVVCLPVRAADIVTDKTAPESFRPTVLQTAGGLPQVNIRTPNTGGVSVNQYRRFDVSEGGVVLNNSRSATATRLAGWVQGNPWLAGGEARVIVNQVNSSDPSRLNGYIEVAGRRAEVVMANPAGIRVDGGGFINAAGVTLAGGRPVFDKGHLSAYDRNSGRIEIAGRGLDTSDADYTRILVRSAEIGAPVWAKELHIAAGADRFEADGSVGMKPLHDTKQVVIDTSALGGMYAGKITLVASGGHIRNAGQVFAETGNVVLSADGRLSNSGSIIASDKAGDASTATVRIGASETDNTGTLSAQGGMQIDSSRFANDGVVVSAGEMILRSRNIRNSKTIQAGRFDIASAVLTNNGILTQGGKQGLDVDAGRVANSGAIGIAADTRPSKDSAVAGASALDAGILKVSDDLNNSGRIEAGGDIVLYARAQLDNSGMLQLAHLQAGGGRLNNQGGSILTRSADINTRLTDNSKGSLAATQNLKLTGETLINAQGSLESGHTFDAAVQNLDNQSGRIAAQNATVRTQTILNTEGRLDAGILNLSAGRLDNRRGSIRTDGTNTLQLSDDLQNDGGHISSLQNIRLYDGGNHTLTLNNRNGSILSTGDVDVQAKSLDTGELSAGGRLSIDLKDDFTNSRNLQAGKELHLATRGRLDNSGVLEGGETVSLSAAIIDNRRTGIIRSDESTVLNAVSEVHNRGLVNSNGQTLIRSGVLNNIGSGRIYGHHVAVGATRLENAAETIDGQAKAAVIAARERLDIGAQQIENRDGAQLSSEDHLNIGGTLDEQYRAVGDADKLNNTGARIEAAGDAHIAVQDLQNRNAKLRVEDYLASQRRIESYYRSGETTPFFTNGDDGYVKPEQHDYTFHYKDGRPHVHLKESAVENVWKEDYIQTIYKQRIVESNPGEILIGGNLTGRGNWLNADSRILVGGSLEKDGIRNTETKMQLRTVNNGARRRGSHDRHGTWGSRHIEFDKDVHPVGSPPVREVDFEQPAGIVEAHTGKRPTVGTSEAAQISRTDVDVQAADKITVRTLTDIIKLPVSALYTVSPDHPSYLVETDPAYTDRRRWLSGSYMLGALGLEDGRTHKRLGDGYYEQKLVNEQIARLTGYRRLEGHRSDEAQYQALMDAGLDFAREQQLSPGIALSAEQAARLTKDIVWFSPQTVTLNDGSSQTVLVPQVYLRAKTGSINGSGALISAQQLHTEGGSIDNSGTLAGRQSVHLNADHIRHSGQIQGGRILLEAQNDLDIEGGSINAAKLLALRADKIKIATTTATTGDSANGQTILNRIAGLTAEGKDSIIDIEAKQDITLSAADIRNASGHTRLSSRTGNIILDTINLSESSSYGSLSDRNHRHTSRSIEIGSRIESGGDIQLSSAADTRIRQGYIESATGNVLIEGRNIQLESGRRLDTSDESHEHKSRSLSGSKHSYDHYSQHKETAQKSSLSGRTVGLYARKNIHIEGADIVSDDLTELKAQGNIDLKGAINRSHEAEAHERKKSGISGRIKSSIFNLAIGTTRNSLQQQATTETAEASRIGSLKGNLNIAAGGSLRTAAAELSAGSDASLRAREIELGALMLKQSEQIQTHNKSSGLKLALNLKSPETRMAQRFITGIGEAARADGFKARSLTWEKHHLGGHTDYWASPVSIGLSRDNSQSQESRHQTTAHGSLLSAGGHTALEATDGNLTLTAAHAHGKAGIYARAKGDIRVHSAEENTQINQIHTTRSSGLMPKAGTAAVFIGTKREHSNEHSSTVHHNSSTLNSGNTLTLTAGETYSQIASHLTSAGDTDILARNIDILSGSGAYRSGQHYRFEQKGLHIGADNAALQAIDKLKAAEHTLHTAQNSSGRTQAMAVANAGMQTYQAYQSANSNRSNPSQGISLNITYGEQRNSQESQVQGNTQSPSSITAQGRLNLSAQSTDKQSDINITGSQISGKTGTHLSAKRHIQIQSAVETQQEQSRSNQNGWNAGVALSLGKGISLGITAGGNIGRGQTDSSQTHHIHSIVGDPNSPTTLNSNSTTLQGGQIQGHHVRIRTNRLDIESVQDSAHYHSKEHQGSAQITVGYGFSGSADYNQSKTEATHQSTTHQSGIFAGDGGFDIKVGGHTQLKGGLITATEKAEQNHQNHFQTTTYNQSDLENHSHYHAQSIGIGGAGGKSGTGIGKSSIKLTDQNRSTSFSAGYGSKTDSQNSLTRSGIGTRNIRIAADSDGTQTQTAYTAIRTETAQANTGRLKNLFDKEKVETAVRQQREVGQEFGKNAPQAIAAVSDKLGDTRNYERHQIAKTLLEAELQNAGTEAEKAAVREKLSQVNTYLTENQNRYHTWKEGGAGRSILHGAAGGLATGNLSGALAGSGTSFAAPYLDKVSDDLGNTGKALINTLGGAAIGLASGGNIRGAAVGVNVDWNNRQLHPKETALADKYAEALKREVEKREGRKISSQEAAMRIRRQILRWVDKSSQDGYTDQAVISTIGMKGEDKALGYTWDYRDYATRNPQAYNNPKLFEEYRQQDKPEYRNLTWLHSGTKDSAIRQSERQNEELALNVADGLTGFINPSPRVRAAVRATVGSLKNIKPTTTGSDPLLAGAGNIRIPSGSNAAKGDVPSTALATTEHKYKGGAHSETKKPSNDGLDSHHCPAKDCYKGAPISSEQGPAIKMDPKDHAKTASYGSGKQARKYRETQQKLLEQGKLKEAIEMDVKDIRSKFGSKYDKAIEEMLEYSGKLDPNSFKK